MNERLCISLKLRGMTHKGSKFWIVHFDINRTSMTMTIEKRGNMFN